MGKINIPTKKAGDFELPVLGLGTWQMGGRYESSHLTDQKDLAGIKMALEAGITHIDTAEIYGDGHSEELVCEAIKAFDRRQLFITSKVQSGHLRYDQVIAALRGSLGRLGIKYLDLYLIHAPGHSVPLKETMRAMDNLYENELIENFGVSNFHVPLLEEAMASTKYKIVNNQIHYNLAVRDYDENGTIDFCRAHGILVTAYRPTDKGGFAAGGPLLQEIGARYGKTPIQVAINWVMSKPGVVTLVKTSNPAHLKEDLGALGWELKAKDEKALDEKFPRKSGINIP